MAIQGISVTKENNYVLCSVNDFSDELKNSLKEELTFICHGKNEVEEYNLNVHSYENTLKEFLKRYSSKTDETKKGMMGELIAHLIINKVLPSLETLTILFNKEEISIRKGFDLTYLETEQGSIWYGEVKSGEVGVRDTPNSKNKKLITDAKNGMQGFLSDQRSNLWESVIIDVGLSLKHDKRKTVKELLDNDQKDILNSSAKKNAILISVLFHDVNNPITSTSLNEQFLEISNENIFSDVILFSIQKSTYLKIEEFLRGEIQIHD